jgi:uncharacterized protein (TIGR02246 family)
VASQGLTCEAAIRTLLDQLDQAWAKGDGAGYAAGFTADATYTTFVGTVYRSREDIARAHQALFDTFLKGTKLAGEVQDIRFLGPDTAVVTACGEVYKRKPKKPAKVQTYTLVREDDGQWRVAAFQNTKRRTLMEATSFAFAPATAPTGYAARGRRYDRVRHDRPGMISSR